MKDEKEKTKGADPESSKTENTLGGITSIIVTLGEWIQEEIERP